MRERTILFVDDEAKSRKYFQRLFQERFDIMLAADGGEALTIFGRHRGEIGTVVTDQIMPRVTGLDLLREVERLGPEVVRILSTAFESMVRYVPRWIELLPIRREALASGDAAAAAGGDVILEPDAATIFEHLVPRYLETRVYNALIEAVTSEYASRRVAMKNATDAAKDMQGALKLVYNRKRQETITKELLDIVGGVEALR